jgi:hypothetical protein
LKPEATTKPIQSLRVGDRVLADNPEASDRERAAWREPAWEDWLHLTLQMPLIDPTADSHSDRTDDDVAVLHIELLRPEVWFEQQVGLMVEPQQPPSGVVDAASWFPVASDEDATQLPLSPLRPVFRKLAYSSVAIESRGGSLVGLTVEMDLPEMGALGTAIVTDIQPCPRVRAGAGHVITATFKHPPATEVLNVRFEGETEPIGVTDNHPFWSEDRQRFVAIGKMQIGERVRTYQGETKRIETKLPRPGPKTVYNLEVQGPHTYHIGTQGLLVHNSYARGQQPGSQRSASTKSNAALEGRMLTGRLGKAGDPLDDLFEYANPTRASRQGLGFAEEGHHFWPKWLGGSETGPLLRVRMGIHRGKGVGMHQQLNEFLVNSGVVPTNKLNNSAWVRQNLSSSQVKRALYQFYRTKYSNLPGVPKLLNDAAKSASLQ